MLENYLPNVSFETSFFFFEYEIIRYNHQNDIMICNHEYDIYIETVFKEN